MSPDGSCRYLSSNAACERHSNYTLYDSTVFSPRFTFSVTSIIAIRHACRAMTATVCTWRPGFNAWPVHKIFLVQKVALSQVFSYYLVSPVSIVPLIFYTHLHLQSTVIRRTRRRKTRNLEINQYYSDIRKHWTANGLLTGHRWGKWKARDDYEYWDIESTLYILIFKK